LPTGGVASAAGDTRRFAGGGVAQDAADVAVC
jgi:hypothetical protein